MNQTTPTVADQKARAAHLATLSCPRCGARGGVYEAQPEHSTGPAPAAFPELRTRAALLGCRGCPWTGAETDLRSDENLGNVAELMKKKRTKGKGGGGNGKGRKKPVQWKPGDTYRGDGQAPLGAPDQASRVTVIETKSARVELRLTPGDKARAESLARARNMTLSDLLMEGLRLTDSLTPSQWRWWRREAESRDLQPEQLLAAAALEWQGQHVPDVPLL